MGAGSTEELRLSWGGEKGLAEIDGAQLSSSNEEDSSRASEPVSRSSISVGKQDTDSGRGSSSASMSLGNSASRGGSGRSTNTDTTDVGEDMPNAPQHTAPLKKPQLATIGANSRITNAQSVHL
eukprot:jgi/Hompol1/6139/HPOL_000508-RA